MTYDEFMAWRAFHNLHPFDDFHRFHRPAALIGASMGGDLEGKLDWLSPQPQGDPDSSVVRALGG